LRRGVHWSDNYDDDEELPYHEERYASQYRFICKYLMEVLLSNGNPFEEHNGVLIKLDNKMYKTPAAAESVHKVHSIG